MALQAGAASAPLNLPGWPQTTDSTPLRARVLVLDDGTTRLALVSLTVIALVRKQADLVRQAVAQAASVPFENVLCACTHVHSGPPVFGGDPVVREQMTAQVAAAAAEAAAQAATLQPAALGHHCDNLPGVSRVRRILRRDGTAITLRRAWPQWWGWANDPETVGPEEPLDDLLTVMRVDDAAGDPLAAVFHFTCHPIPDYFGYAADLIERTTGVPCLVLNGCQGSVDTPFEVRMRGRTQEAQLPILGQILGYRALELFTRAETTAEAKLGVCSREVFLPVSAAFLDSPAEKAAIWPEALRDGGFNTLVQCLRLGDLALAGIPGEAHVGFGQQVSEISPFALTRPVGLANDEVGYLFGAEARVRGGYEPDPQYWGVVEDQGLEIILKAAAECLRELPL
jgi:neutral ceramidase